MAWFWYGGKKEKNLGGLSQDSKIWEQGILNVNDEFVQACLLRDLGALAQDILQPYIFDEKGQFDNAYDYDKRIIYQKSASMKDILMQAMLGQDITISKVRIKNSLTERDFLFIGNPDGQKEELRLAYGKDFAIEKSIVFEKMYSQQDIQLLLLCYQALGYAYNRQNKINKLDAKMILKMKGFHAIFTQPRNDEEEAVAIENRKRLIANFEEILTGIGGVIDSEDSIGLVGGSQNAEKSLSDAIGIIYQEIARILRIPLTRLLGRAPQGMNATGESDALNYDMTLDVYRSLWLEPALKLLQIGYQKVDKIDVPYLKQIIELHILADVPFSDRLKEKIETLGVDL